MRRTPLTTTPRRRPDVSYIHVQVLADALLVLAGIRVPIPTPVRISSMDLGHRSA